MEIHRSILSTSYCLAKQQIEANLLIILYIWPLITAVAEVVFFKETEMNKFILITDDQNRPWRRPPKKKATLLILSPVS